MSSLTGNELPIFVEFQFFNDLPFLLEKIAAIISEVKCPRLREFSSVSAANTKYFET
jgi:hypothetical protein